MFLLQLFSILHAEVVFPRSTQNTHTLPPRSPPHQTTSEPIKNSNTTIFLKTKHNLEMTTMVSYLNHSIVFIIHDYTCFYVSD